MVNYHMRDTVVTIKEEIQLLPYCPKCDTFFTWRALNSRHHATVMCARGEERIPKRRKEEEARRSTAVEFQAYGIPLEAVLEFKYLGRVLTDSDEKCPFVVVNLRKARRRWARMSRILRREGADPRT